MARRWFLACCVSLLVLPACGLSPVQRGALYGGLLGAGAGAGIGTAADSPGRGAVLGALAGAATGALAGELLARRDADAAQAAARPVVLHGEVWNRSRRTVHVYIDPRDDTFASDARLTLAPFASASLRLEAGPHRLVAEAPFTLGARQWVRRAERRVHVAAEAAGFSLRIHDEDFE